MYNDKLASIESRRKLLNKIEDKLLSKSIEAFIMGIEIYNKPTIKYRVEGFSFFICNAWELMLKSHLIKIIGQDSIYFKDNPDRTISLENCIRKTFTNDKDPLRINLEKIIELRNTSTHFITEEYEMLYISLFQACLFNFTEKIQEFHNVDMTEIIPQNFLTLTVSMKFLNQTEIRAKYPEEIATKLVRKSEELSKLIEANNHGFAIKIEHHHYITKNKNKATAFVNISKGADSDVKIIKELKDPNDTHKYSAKACIKEINKKLKKENIDIDFNMYHFRIFSEYYNIKSNDKLCYTHKIHKHPTYSYSIQAIDLIFSEIKKDPKNIIQNLKDKLS